MVTKKKDGDKRPFEDMVKELEGIVERLEKGSLSLEGSLAAFEQGVGLVRQLTTTLDEVQRRVEVLVRDEGTGGLRTREVREDEEEEEDQNA
jgi:exodeoxyribonuclease VII small subunit